MNSAEAVEVQPDATPAPEHPVVAAETAGPTPAPVRGSAPLLAPDTAGGQFLASTGLLENLAPIRDLNRQFILDTPHFDELFPAIEDNPARLKSLLHFANAGWFKSRVQIETAHGACTRYGTEGFYRIALAAFVTNAVGDFAHTRTKIWPHMESVARATEIIADHLAPECVDDLFAAALMHDAAVPLMERSLRDYVYFVECALNLDPLVAHFERRANEFDHAQIAAETARALSFNPAVVQAIQCHHYESLATIQSPESRAILSLLICAKRAVNVWRGGKKSPFETSTEKALLKEIGATLDATPGKIQHAIGETVELLKIQYS